MKTLGLIGGTTWLSTVDYYKYLNRLTNERLGGSASARLILYSVNFAELMEFVNADDWDAVGRYLSDIARKLESAGAEGLLLCANTLHLVAETVQSNIRIPVLHIVDAVADAIKRRDLSRVSLLGTRFTMEQPFYRDRLQKLGIDAIIPDTQAREFIHNSIYQEFDKNIFSDETKRRYLEIIHELNGQGAQGSILGCTEIPLLIKQEDCDVPVFDTTLIHAHYAVDFALSDTAAGTAN